MPEDNLYELLQVEPTADRRTIRSAYRRLMLRHHPDRNAGVDAQEMAQRLNRAYEILRNPERRAAYDWELSGEPGEPPGGAGLGISGLFPKPVWLAGAGGAVAIAVIVIAIVLATGGGEPDSKNQTTQVVAPVPTPDLTPPVIPGPTAAAEGSVTPAATPTASFLFESGEAFIRNGDFVQAIEEFTRAINLIPGYGFGYQVRGDSYFQLAQYPSAIQDYDTAIELDPNNKSAYSGRGRSHYRLDQYQLAIDDFDKAILIDSRFASAYSRRGLAYGQLQEFELSKLDTDRACSLDSQYCSPLLSIVPTPTPPATSTPPLPTPTRVPGSRIGHFIFPSSTISIKSNATIESK